MKPVEFIAQPGDFLGHLDLFVFEATRNQTKPMHFILEIHAIHSKSCEVLRQPRIDARISTMRNRGDLSAPCHANDLHRVID